MIPTSHLYGVRLLVIHWCWWFIQETFVSAVESTSHQFWKYKTALYDHRILAWMFCQNYFKLNFRFDPPELLWTFMSLVFGQLIANRFQWSVGTTMTRLFHHKNTFCLCVPPSFQIEGEGYHLMVNWFMDYLESIYIWWLKMGCRAANFWQDVVGAHWEMTGKIHPQFF